MKGHVSVSPTTVLNRLIDDFAKFEGEGFLITLREFLNLEPQKRGAIRDRAADLSSRIERFVNWLEATKMLADIPVINVPADKLDHFDARIKPVLRTLQCLTHDDPELLLEAESEIDELFGEVQGAGIDLDAISDPLKMAALELLGYFDVDVLDSDERFISVEIDLARTYVDSDSLARLKRCLLSKYFQPSRWIQRASNVRAVTSPRLPEQFPLRIRGRLKEAFDSYIVGHYFASIASCRSLLEFVLLDRAKPAFGFDPYVERHDKRQAMDLHNLVENVKSLSPELGNDLHFVREVGNGLLHPRKGREVNQFPPQERTARKVLSIVFELVSRLYAKQ